MAAITAGAAGGTAGGTAGTDVPTTPVAPTDTIEIRYIPYGAARELFECREKEVCLDGPAGTGKTIAALNKAHAVLLKYAGARALIARKTNTALAGSALVTYREQVLRDEEGVEWFGGNKTKPAAYHYPNGSELIVNGLDKPEKVKSTEFDLAYINEATECSEEDVEFVRARLRHGKMPYQQLILDDNPGPPTHWLNLRMNAGRTKRLLSRHEDNPRFYDHASGQWTADGIEYIKGTLGGLTGVRYQRLALGIWAAAEGMVYQDAWDARRNLVDRADVEVRNPRTGHRELPRTWPRYLSIDFGFNHPFVCQWWAQDPDGRLYLYREIYMTNRLVQTHAADILNAAGWAVNGGRLAQARADGDPLPYLVIADPEDAEGRAQLARYLGCAISPAHKEVKQGIQAVASRMTLAGDKKPRLVLLRDSLVERDPILVERKAPTCTAEEVESYVWRRDSGGQPLDEPIKQNDHGLDACRYVVAQIDLHPMGVDYGPNIWS